MKKTTNRNGMEKHPYLSPESMILEINSEGVLCFSPSGSSADDITLGNEITDYEQIY